MSRAFVSESDSDFQDEDLPEIRNPLPRGTRNYMTPEGAERMQHELHDLTTAERPRAAAKVARVGGGTSNTDRDAHATARHRLHEIERRIEYLRRMSAILEVVDPENQDPGRVAFGATVKVREGDSVATYRIVGVDESSPESGRISWITPIAKALIGAQVGQTVQVKLPRGDSLLRVEQIRYELPRTAE